MEAVDGIGGVGVTRVQTCALPILIGSTVINGGTANFNASASTLNGMLSAGTLSGTGALTVNGTLSWTAGTMSGSGATVIPNRSEERRVGKECRSRWSPDH